MAARTQALCQLIVSEYDGEPAAVWSTAASGAELLKRVSALPGFGEQKAKIFVALLGKQLGVRPAGWREAAGPFGDEGSYLSVADISDAESLARVRSYKQALKAAAKEKAAATSLHSDVKNRSSLPLEVLAFLTWTDLMRSWRGCPR
jgi:uncharacterized HhH-GPD family protein